MPPSEQHKNDEQRKRKPEEKKWVDETRIEESWNEKWEQQWKEDQLLKLIHFNSTSRAATQRRVGHTLVGMHCVKRQTPKWREREIRMRMGRGTEFFFSRKFIINKCGLSYFWRANISVITRNTNDDAEISISSCTFFSSFTYVLL